MVLLLCDTFISLLSVQWVMHDMTEIIIFTFSTKLTLLNLCPLSRTWAFQIGT